MGCHFLLQGIFPDPGIQPVTPASFLALPAGSLLIRPWGSQVLISYLLYLQYCVYIDPNLPVYPYPPNPLPWLFLEWCVELLRQG